MALRKVVILTVLLFCLAGFGETDAPVVKKKKKIWKPKDNGTSAFLGLQSFQTSASLELPSGTLQAAHLNTIAAEAGFGWKTPLFAKWSFEIQGSILFGSSEFSSENDGGSPSVSFLAKSPSTVGFRAVAAALWDTGANWARVGLAIPFVYYNASMPELPVGTLRTGGPLKVGAYVLSRFSRGRITVTPQIGFLSGLGRFAWAIQAGWML